MTSKHSDMDGGTCPSEYPRRHPPSSHSINQHRLSLVAFTHLGGVLWENRIKGEHLRRNLAASFLEGILTPTGQGVVQGDLLLPWIHLQERAGF